MKTIGNWSFWKNEDDYIYPWPSLRFSNCKDSFMLHINWIKWTAAYYREKN